MENIVNVIPETMHVPLPKTRQGFVECYLRTHPGAEAESVTDVMLLENLQAETRGRKPMPDTKNPDRAAALDDYREARIGQDAFVKLYGQLCAVLLAERMGGEEKKKKRSFSQNLGVEGDTAEKIQKQE